MSPHSLPQAAIDALAVDAKIGLLATVGEGGLPHVSLITSLAARDPDTLMYGQFCEGRAKSNPRRNPKVAWLIMDKARRVWRGTATFREARTTGPEVDAYNRKPLFRYNSYFGIHTAHLFDVAGSADTHVVGLPPLLAGGALARAAAWASRRRPRALKPWARGLVNGLTSVKFLAYVRPDGTPWLTSAVGCATADGRGLHVVDLAHGDDLRAIQDGASVAVLALNLSLESVMARGTWVAGRGPLASGAVDLDLVYNSMPPKQGVIWPEVPLEPVTAP